MTPVDNRWRGWLKLYLSYASGVGKTYRLLEEAHSLQKDGVDVVIVFAETHGRLDTAALLSGLEELPRRRVDFRGLAVEEMDLDAALARRPEVAIVDDLPHSNVPGSRHYKRYQDVLDLLDAGVNVIGAFDIQHLESLKDLIERAATVTIHETIPDTFLNQADRVVSLDLDIEDLRDRVRTGKVCAAEQVDAALTGAFRIELLSAMRALCLREVAEAVDRAALRHRRPQARLSAPEDRVMVCLAPDSRRPAALLRRGSRLAGRLNTDWYAVFVAASHEASHPTDVPLQRRLDEVIHMAQELGAEVVRVEARDPAPALINFARSHGVGTLVIGRSRRAWSNRVLRRTHMDRVIDAAEGFDVFLVSDDGDGP